MLPVTPTLIPEPFAEEGTKNVIPAESPGASEPNASWARGFPPVTMLNRQAGGKPPLGNDFNGILNALSQHLFFTQSGCVYPWQGADEASGFAGLNYLKGAHVLGSDMREYIAQQPSGPDVPANGGGYVGPRNPVQDANHVYWAPLVTPGDIPEFDGTTIKLINGKYGAPKFTPPTASAPGKSGLAPAPPKAAYSAEERFFINAKARFSELSPHFVVRSAESASADVLAPVVTDSAQEDLNKLYAGVYVGQNWANPPIPEACLGWTRVFQTPQLEGEKYGYYQEYVDGNTGNLWVRCTASLTGNGEFPDWAPWSVVGAPKPTGRIVVGRWIALNNLGGNTITLPGGGVWAFHAAGYNTTANGLHSGDHAGVLAGGTVIKVGNSSTEVRGFAWRIA